MKNKFGHKRFYELLEVMADIHNRKNQNYAKTKEPLSNLKMSQEFGVSPFLGTLTRMSDKWSRIVQLAGGKQDKVGESIKDTLLDLSVYSLLAIILFEENKGKKIKVGKIKSKK